MRKKIGALTIGQSPRNDIIPDLEVILGPEVDILQAGVLDDLSDSEITLLTSSNNEDTHNSHSNIEDNILVTRLRNSKWISLSERKILPLIQQRLRQLEEQGVNFNILLCTGAFPENFSIRKPLIFPQKLLSSVVPQLVSRVGVVVPEAYQIAQCKERWEPIVRQVTVVHANPYENTSGLEIATERFRDNRTELCVLDCMGYNLHMKNRLKDLTGLPVVLPRTLIARIMSELLA